MKAPSEGKSTQGTQCWNGQQRYRWQYESIFIRLAVVGPQICEIPWNSDKVRTYSTIRSSKAIDLGVNWESACNFLLVINSNFGRISYLFFRYWRLKLEYSLFSHPSLIWHHSSGNPLEFLDKTYSAKSTGIGLLCGENFMIRPSTVLTDPPV